jgi:hypothetical protein
VALRLSMSNSTFARIGTNEGELRPGRSKPRRSASGFVDEAIESRLVRDGAMGSESDRWGWGTGERERALVDEEGLRRLWEAGPAEDEGVEGVGVGGNWNECEMSMVLGLMSARSCDG